MLFQVLRWGQDMKRTCGWLLHYLLKLWFWFGVLLLALIPFSFSEPDALCAFLVFGLSFVFLSYVFVPTTQYLMGIEREPIDVESYRSQLRAHVSDEVLMASIEKKNDMQAAAAGLSGLAIFMLLTVKPLMSITKASVPAFVNTLLAFGILYFVYVCLKKVRQILSASEINPWLTALIQTALTSVEHGVLGLDKDHPRNPVPEQLMGVFFLFIGFTTLGGGLVHGTLVTVLLGCAFGVMFFFIGANALANLGAYWYPHWVLWAAQHRPAIRWGLLGLLSFSGAALAVAIVIDQFYR
jgi:hypothetical protein